MRDLNVAMRGRMMGREEVLEGQGIPQSGVEAVDGNHDSNGGVIVSTTGTKHVTQLSRVTDGQEKEGISSQTDISSNV